jgi:hypothetical protein
MTHTETVKARFAKAERLLYISCAHLDAIRENERTSYVQKWIMSQIKRHQKVVSAFNEAKFQVGMLNPLTRSYFGAPPLED